MNPRAAHRARPAVSGMLGAHSAAVKQPNDPPGSAGTTPRREVLIVSSDPLTREVFHDGLSAEGYECLLAADGREGIEMFRGWRPPLAVTDVDLPHMDGLELLRAVRHEDPDAAVVVMLGLVRDEHGDAAYVKQCGPSASSLARTRFLRDR